MEPKYLSPRSEERPSKMYFKPHESILHPHTNLLWTTLVNDPSMTKYLSSLVSQNFRKKKFSKNISYSYVCVFFFFLDLVTLIIFEEE
jgi:hypothetical protein